MAGTPVTLGRLGDPVVRPGVRRVHQECYGHRVVGTIQSSERLMILRSVGNQLFAAGRRQSVFEKLPDKLLHFLRRGRLLELILDLGNIQPWSGGLLFSDRILLCGFGLSSAFGAIHK